MERSDCLLPSTKIFPEEEGRGRMRSGKLRIKFGVDPTSPNLHLGHAVALRQLRLMQDDGHTVLLVIGDFTAAIGDPTGRNTTRPPLTTEEIEENAKTYLDQAFLILDPGKTEVSRNGTWLGMMSAAQMVRMAASATVAQMSQRKDFSKRLAEQAPIALHEFLYPLFQGQDSVHLQSDAEMGGTDQTFNLLMGRDMQATMGQVPQFVMTVPLLVGLDGEKKMSKSHGNEVGLRDDPVEKFSKIMRLTDDMVPEWGDLLTDVPKASWQGKQRDGNPRDIKFELAQSIVAWLHGSEISQRAGQAWEAAVRQSVASQDLPLMEFLANESGQWIIPLLVQAGLVPSKTVARQKVLEGAVRIDGERVMDYQLSLDTDKDILMQVGKRHFRRIILRSA